MHAMKHLRFTGLALAVLTAMIVAPVLTHDASATSASDNQNHLYTLDGWGRIHPVGSAPALNGSAYWPDWDIARGMVSQPGLGGGYVLDGFGGVHPFGGAPAVSLAAYWPGWDIARGIALRPDGVSGYVLDGFGGVHPFGGAPAVNLTAYWSGWDIARGIALDASGNGGWVLDGFGGLHRFGDAPAVSISAYWGWNIARAVVSRPNGSGGYVLDGFGGLHPFGGAPAVSSSAYWQGWDIARGAVMWTGAPAGTSAGWVVDGFGGVHPFGGAPNEAVHTYWNGWDIIRGLGGGSGSGGSQAYNVPPPAQRQCFAYTAAGSAAFTVNQVKGLQSSPCAGISWTFPWSEIEPGNGTYNWSPIDHALAASGGKPVILRVIPGLTSPSWIPRSDGIVVPDPKGGSGWMPIPWNPAFLAIFKQFVMAFGARYNSNPHIAIIEGNGDGPQGEAHLTGSYAQWQAVGYSEQTYINAIATDISYFKAAFPSHKVSFAGATPPSGAPSTPNLEQAFLATCEQAHIVIQNNGLTGSAYGHINQNVIEFGYQTAHALGTGLGAALSLAARLGASFVEVYYSDARNPSNYAAIRAFQGS